MRHNKWMLGCFGCLAACAIPGGMGAMLGVFACIACAGGCFAKWLWEEDKFEKVEYEKYLKEIEKRLTNNSLCDTISVRREK